MSDAVVEEAGASESKGLALVRWLTTKAIQGVPPLSPAQTLVDEYLSDTGYRNHGARIDALINWETTKNFSSGFLTGLGGLITLPVAIPASISASWLVQARMSATIAGICGYDIQCDRVQTFVIATLLGDAVKDIIKTAGLQIGKGIAREIIKQVPGKVMFAINKQVGFRLITKAGSTGVVNLMKFVPVLGGVIGGTVDAVACRAVGKTAKSVFHGTLEDDATLENA